jgi:hypothetical protein
MSYILIFIKKLFEFLIVGSKIFKLMKIESEETYT